VRAVALVPVIVIGAGFVVFCLVDLARARKVRYLPKWAWALVCLISVPLGGILYLIFGRPRLQAPS
jgi:Phospholipase_D-nuclease N-terminal